MTETRKWTVGTAVLALLILVAGWFLLVSPKRSAAAELSTQTDAQHAANAVLQTKITVLQQQSKNLPQMQAKLERIQVKLPDNPALPGLVRQLTDAANKAGVELTSLAPTVPAPLPVAAVATTTTTTAAGTTLQNGQVAMLPIVVQATGGYFELEKFVSNVEQLQRAFLVNGFTIADQTASNSGSSDGTTTPTGQQLTLNGRVFMVPTTIPAAPVTVPPTTTDTTTPAS